MEAKDYQEIINTADCNAEVNFVDADEQLQIMGWAKILIETAYKAGIREVVEWIGERRQRECDWCGAMYELNDEVWQAFKESKGVK